MGSEMCIRDSLNAPGARANHAVPAVFLEGGGAGREVLLLVFRMSQRDLEVLLHEVSGDCLFVVGRRVPQRLVQLSACTQEDTQEL